MTGPLQNVSPGQPLSIPADTWNAFIAVARDHRAEQAGLRGTFERGGRPPDTANVVIVQNGSGAARDQFAILGVDEPVILPEDNEGEFTRRVALSCVAPAAGHAGRFVVLAEPLPAGAIGRAVIDGVTVVRVSVSDEAHARAEVAAGQAGYLVSGASGSAAILWREGGTGEQWAVVRLGAPAVAGSAAVLWGKVKTDWPVDTRPNFVTVNPCDRDGGNVDTGTDVTVYIGYPEDTDHADPTWHKNLKAGEVIPYLDVGDGDGVICTRFFGHNTWGKVYGDGWEPGDNFVMVQLCDEDGVVTLADTVKCWLFAPESVEPQGVALEAGDVIPLLVFKEDPVSGKPVAYALSVYHDRWFASQYAGQLIVGDGSSGWTGGPQPVPGAVLKHTGSGLAYFSGQNGSMMVYIGGEWGILPPPESDGTYYPTLTKSGGGFTFGWDQAS